MTLTERIADLKATIEVSRLRLAAQVATDADHCCDCGEELSFAGYRCEPCGEAFRCDRAADAAYDAEGDR